MVLKLSGLTKHILLQYAKAIGLLNIDVTIGVSELRQLIERTQGTQEVKKLIYKYKPKTQKFHQKNFH